MIDNQKSENQETYIITPEKEFKIKTLCDFLFFDIYSYFTTYLRFERCIQPLINNLNISTDRLFKELAGKKINILHIIGLLIVI